MYILNDHSGAIVNSNYVEEFFLMDTSDSTLLYLRLAGEDKPITLERFGDRKEAMDALSRLFYALGEAQSTFLVPQSTYYYREKMIRDARTKRRGGS